MTPEISTRRIVIQTGVWFGATLILLFLGAGTLAWPEAWIYVVIQISTAFIGLLWFKKRNPELLKVRMDFWKRLIKPWDKAIVVLLFVAFVPFYVLPGVDVIRYRWSHIPIVFEIIGFLGILVSSGVGIWALVANPYSSGAVEIQKERGHKVISTGPYQYIRHPMYLGAILGFFATSLALGSILTFVPSAVLTGILMARTYLEDKTLQQELEGYADYARKVKYRLFPGIW
jgi:protein-S-isoprenylcysteine O-methyltransferase Ste14